MTAGGGLTAVDRGRGEADDGDMSGTGMLAGQPAVVRRLLVPTPRSDLRATWHEDGAAVALSLWRGDACVGSAWLSTADAARLASFLVAHLGARAAAAGLDEA